MPTPCNYRNNNTISYSINLAKIESHLISPLKMHIFEAKTVVKPQIHFSDSPKLIGKIYYFISNSGWWNWLKFLEILFSQTISLPTSQLIPNSRLGLLRTVKTLKFLPYFQANKKACLIDTGRRQETPGWKTKQIISERTVVIVSFFCVLAPKFQFL